MDVMGERGVVGEREKEEGEGEKKGEGLEDP